MEKTGANQKNGGKKKRFIKLKVKAMARYILKRKNKNKKIKQFNFEDCGYTLKPNIKNNHLIKISNLFLFKEDSIHALLIKQYEKSFRRLAAIAYSTINDEDATSSDAIIALDEVARQKSRLIKKDKEYLTKEEEEKLKKRFKMLEQELKIRLQVLKEEEERNFTR